MEILRGVRRRAAGAGINLDAVALEQEKRTEGVAVDQFIEARDGFVAAMLEERRLVFVHLVEVEAVAVVLVADHLEAQGARFVLQRAIGIEQACRGERFALVGGNVELNQYVVGHGIFPREMGLEAIARSMLGWPCTH